MVGWRSGKIRDSACWLTRETPFAKIWKNTLLKAIKFSNQKGRKNAPITGAFV